ncbi:MAG TPA: ABC transporter ATP-binding protein [Mycobacteriales bacterium]|nr:ABC transporter ATP-binding protein [Mycobacteriales bacterium]
MLEIKDLHVSYGGSVRALQGVTLTVPDGEVVAVLGSNGAGKTTLLRTVSATLKLHGGSVRSGTATYGGKSLAGLDAAQTVRLGIVQVPEGRRVFGRMTVEENLRAGGMGARDRRTRVGSRDRVYDLFPVLAQRRTQRAALMSGGEQQMLAIGRGLMASPELLILDEPSLGLAPQIVGQIGQVIRAIHDMGTSVLLVEQNATMALAVANSAYVLELGRVSLTGPAAELAATDDVRRLYLGHTVDTAEQTPESAGVRVGAGARLGRWQR